MKNCIKSLIAALILSATVANAQNTRYREIYDDPLYYKKLFINLHIANLDVASPTSMRFGVGAEFMLTKRIWLSADIDHVFEKFSTVSDAVKKTATALEGGLIFNFRAKIKKGKIQYRWKETGGEYKMTVDGNVLRTMGLRGGVFSFSSPKELTMGNYKAHFTSAGIYGGIVFGAIRCKAISAEGIKMRHTDKETKGIFFIEGMFAPVVTYFDNTDYSHPSTSPPPVNIDTMVTKNHFGARIGWTKTIRYPIPVQYGFEGGIRPGLQSNYFFTCKIAIALGFIHGGGKKEEGN